LEFQKDSYPPRWNSEGLTALDREVKVPSTNRFSSRPTCYKYQGSPIEYIETSTDKKLKISSYWNPLGRIFLYRGNLIYCLVATANFKIIIVMGVVPIT
jgi:hypothetical protein